MSRSVSYASNSLAVAYTSFETDDQSDSQWEWDMFMDDVKERIQENWKSFSECDKFLGSEDHAIMENKFAYISISEYCGLVSLSLVPKELDNECANLAENFCVQIKNKFLKEFGTLNKIGSMSNGEGVFERVA